MPTLDTMPNSRNESEDRVSFEVELGRDWRPVPPNLVQLVRTLDDAPHQIKNRPLSSLTTIATEKNSTGA